MLLPNASLLVVFYNNFNYEQYTQKLALLRPLTLNVSWLYMGLDKKIIAEPGISSFKCASQMFLEFKKIKMAWFSVEGQQRL